jgi:hypothetical protein
MGLRQRAREAFEARQEEILAEKIRTTRQILHERFGVKDEELDTFEAASIGLCGADKTIRIEDLLFMVDDAGQLHVRDQRATTHTEDPWKPVESLADLGQITAQSTVQTTPRI